jgi:G:T/U-mismatch repair DNA glycosylase
MEVGRRMFKTLADILPEHGPMKILIIGEKPAKESIKAGHYFQGNHGKSLLRQLQDYGLLKVPEEKRRSYNRPDRTDEVFLEYGIGVTDLYKHPSEIPTGETRTAAIKRVKKLISRLQPTVVLFMYKGVLETVTGRSALYGFNPDLEEEFGCKVFACPLPGVGGQNFETIHSCMTDLAEALHADA